MTNFEFKSLVLGNVNSLSRHAVYLTRDTNDAKDLVQDTMLKGLRSYHLFKKGTNLEAWLYTIMRNTFINNYRQIAKTNTFVTKSDDISCPNLLFSSSKNHAESKFVMDDIKSAIDKLPSRCKLPFTMYYEGHKYHEIANELIMPIGTVKTQIYTARKLLKDDLKSYDKDLPIRKKELSLYIL